MCDGDSNGVLHYLGTQHAQTNQRALQHQAVSSYDSNSASSIQLPSSSSFTNTCPTASSSTIQAIPAPGVNASSASTSSAYAPSAYAFSASATTPASPPSTQGHGSTACPPVWVNPAFTKVVDVRASSPAAPRTTDPKAIVGRQFSRINFAGPRSVP